MTAEGGEDLEGLRATLRVLLVREAEALREEAALREAGAPAAEISQASAECRRLRFEINQVERKIRAIQTH